MNGLELLDHQARVVVPEVLDELGLYQRARELRQLPPIRDRESMLAAQALLDEAKREVGHD